MADDDDRIVVGKGGLLDAARRVMPSRTFRVMEPAEAAEIPPPPPGFKLDKPGSMPAPPPGFKVDAPRADKAAPEKSSGLPSSFLAFFKGLGRGAMETVEGGSQIGARMMREPGGGDPMMPLAPPGPDKVAEVDRIIRGNAAAYEQDPARRAHPLASGAGRLVGNVASTLPVAAMVPGGAGSAAGLIGRSALVGGLSAATQPVTPKQPEDYWSEKAKQIGVGAAAGAALPAVGSVIAPRLPSPQAIGSAFRPLKSFLQGGEERTLPGFNRTIARQVLDPIGGNVTQNLKGHKLASAVEDQLDDAYGRVLPHLSLSRDAVVRSASPETREFVSELDPLEGRQFETFVTNKLLKKFPESGIMSGEDFKKVERDFGSRAMSYLGTQKDQLGRALLHTLSDLKEALAGENPTWAPELRRVNESWKMWTRYRQAASGATSHGTFTPDDLLRAIRSQDPTAGRAAFAKGDALLQKYAEAAHSLFNERTSPMQLLHLFSREGLPWEIVKQTAGPLGRAAKRLSPTAAAPLGTELPKIGDRGPAGGTVTGVSRQPVE